MLRDLIADSEESAFERATLPAGIETRLSRVDWTVYDVLVGSIGSKAQFDNNLAENYYYVPAKYVDKSSFPIRYVALYQSLKLI